MSSAGTAERHDSSPAPRHTLAVGHAQGDFARAALATFADADETDALMLAGDLAQLDFDPVDVLGPGGGERLHLVDVAGAYDAFDSQDGDGLLRDWDAVLDRVLADGHTGLRVVADNTAMLTGSQETAERWLRWEQQTDAWQAGRPVTGTCFVDARRVDDDRLTETARLHPVVPAPDAPSWRMFHDVVDGRVRVVLTGELEAWDADVLTEVLEREEELTGAQRIDIDVSALAYLHHRPLRVLTRRHGEERVRLVDAPDIVRLLTSVVPPDADPA